MQINYFPGRIRLRDRILRDDDIRQAAVDVAAKLGKILSVSYNERTGSVLLEYDAESVDMEKISSLVPLAAKLNAKASFYTESKKDEIIALIEKIGRKIDGWANDCGKP
ncbi:hypothetical protein HRI96_08165 [Treponema parvum]|uniref:Uncharacterized protein n=1 Tax=Treponema parvum TaxID=138851 RepID=A0A975F0F2_9SPIR|nr:hypothetical protein [Treponema parvum]QTQ12171.1 hypothetical protein HRI96_08165 [Treponema parvum]QTQ15839.1 hypothetical protein HXT04_03490 [Treponema parvum]